MCCFRDSGAMEEARIFLYERISYQGMESIEISFHSIIYCGVVAEKKIVLFVIGESYSKYFITIK